MIPMPMRSRDRLRWHIFEQRDDTSWVLRFLVYYADLFASLEPALMLKSPQGFLIDHNKQRTKGAYLLNLTEAEIKRIKSFVSDFGQWVVLGLNKHIGEHFTDELDFCLAVDFTADNPAKLEKDERTHMGELIHRAKYESAEQVIPEIAAIMAAPVRRLATKRTGADICLSYIPVMPDRKSYLPKAIAEAIVGKCGLFADPESRDCIIHPLLKTFKPSIKNAPTCERKIAFWENAYSRDQVSLSRSADNCDVFVIDDLYQSGVTLWSYAKYLKSIGAATVYGITGVKTLRDTTNQ